MLSNRLKMTICITGFALLLIGCSRPLTAEQKEQLANLKAEQARLSAELEAAKDDDARYSGGLIKSLIVVRLEILKTNQALVQQRVHALEGGAKTDVVISTNAADPSRASALAKDLSEQREKLADARAEATRYSGGLIHALALSTVSTIANTVAMLDQERLRATYGMTLPHPGSKADARTAPVIASVPVVAPTAPVAVQSAPTATSCLKLGEFDSSVLQSNDVYTEVAWKADIANSCAENFDVRVVFTLFDKEDFKLDSNTEDVRIRGNSTGKARGKMLVSPPEKARRMAKQSR